MLQIRKIYKKQLDFVNDIVSDIIKNECSDEVIAYAKTFADVDVVPDMSMIVVSFDDAKAAIFRNNNGELVGTNWSGTAMGLSGMSYNALVRELTGLLDGEVMGKSPNAISYLRYSGKENWYRVGYTPMETVKVA